MKPLKDGEVIDLGSRSFEVILTPGHIDGHISLLNRAERTLLPGDVIQVNISSCIWAMVWITLNTVKAWSS